MQNIKVHMNYKHTTLEEAIRIHDGLGYDAIINDGNLIYFVKESEK